MRSIILTCCFLIGILSLSCSLYGQKDTVLTLSEVEIIANSIREDALGGKKKTWQGKDLAKVSPSSIADLLSNQSGAFIKSYGLGSLATSSIRGGSAGHTLILWNGLPVQSPMLGQLDLSLLPIASAESISFQKGGNSALWGSGAIGGVISLDNQANFSNRIQVNLASTYGDFGRLQQEASLKLGNKRIQSVSKFSYQKADNDFFYLPAPGLDKRQQSNAEIMQRNLLQDIYLRLNDKNQVSVHIWKQDADREIPPTNVQTRSEAHQTDQSFRVTADWKRFSSKSLLITKAGFFDEYLDYFDDQIGLVSNSHFQTFLGESSLQHNWKKKHQVFIGATHTYTRAWAKAYQDIPSEHKSALFASWKWDLGKLQVQSNIRQEVVNQARVPVVPGLAFSYQVLPYLNFKGKISKNYRLPTFNDRFWRPGGNENLLPESGWSEEASLEFNTKKGSISYAGTITGFNRNIDNWIMWSIVEGQSYWSANNITRVWSRGLEPRLSIRYQHKDLALNWESGYDYILSTNQSAIEAPRLAAGTQLFYTPVHQVFSSASISYKSFDLSYQHSFTGKTKGIYGEVDPFQVANARLQYSLTQKNFRGTCFFRVNNIWDANYFVLERRPMPGINYQFGLNISLTKNQTL